ncbi:MAG TPA: PepSY-associated TM helix domain-containing protein [Steroidobacteraceae bacterium]|nr:PepSY-associated TM helix domain-containing protein [Steroidobacteraceae bacterium]
MAVATETSGLETRSTRLIRAVRRWACIHKWTSLVCTAFLLVICVTGLPLVFSDEIDRWTTPHAYEILPADTPPAGLDRLVAASRRMYPGQIISAISLDDAEPQVYVWMAPSWEALKADPKAEHFIRFDARTAKVLEQSPPSGRRGPHFMDLMAGLHEDLFIGLPGELFLGLMALLFVVAIASGIALYGPFMKKLGFGTVRRERSARLKWLDLHNLLGVAVMAWTCVVGATGLMNELSTPLFALWQRTNVQAWLAPWHGQPVPAASELASAQSVLDTVRRARPAGVVTSIVFPGDETGSPHHYLLWTKGATPLTSQLFDPVLVDARTGQLAGTVGMPWYLRTLEISRPLHFGDYGGLPLKILWAMLDVLTIIVLGSGLYLWLSRRRSPLERRLRQLEEDLAAAQPASPLPGASNPPSSLAYP